MKLYIADKEYTNDNGETIKYKQLYIGVVASNGVETKVPVKPIYKSDKSVLVMFAERYESEAE